MFLPKSLKLVSPNLDVIFDLFAYKYVVPALSIISELQILFTMFNCQNTNHCSTQVFVKITKI